MGCENKICKIGRQMSADEYKKLTRPGGRYYSLEKGIARFIVGAVPGKFCFEKLSEYMDASSGDNCLEDCQYLVTEGVSPEQKIGS